MPKIRVLIVDDAVVFRRLVAEELSSDPMIEVVGTAANGKIALAKLPQVNPDLVILDIEMPEMDGLTALKEIRKLYPKLPVIMFSALTERGAAETLDALALGATDYFTKPTNVGGLDASLQVLRDELIPEIKSLCAAVIGPGYKISTLATPTSPAPLSGMRPTTSAAPLSGMRSIRPGPIEVLAIATSTGGPNALAEVFAGLPGDLPVPVVLVQHMPPTFTKLLAERLSAQFPIPVEEGRSGELLLPGRAWIAPGDYHMIVVRDGSRARILVHQDPPENSCRPAADVLFRSLARVFGPNVLGVVLTGMGQDGLRGCESVKAAGGQVIAQDEESSVVWGMPGFVVRAGLADKVLPLPQVAAEIVRRVRIGRGDAP
ncbi:MAG: chemotaxis response regulator protein-glutamate methylesterase [Planctomycetia bacterium]|nr:chemotaxis response regulator protein-glutamate methylesterase [Planctomycetia bacterium]